MEQYIKDLLGDKIIYIVEYGQYSERYVACITSTEEKANEYINKNKRADDWQGYEITPMIVDQEEIKHLFMYQIFFDKLGNIITKLQDEIDIENTELNYSYYPANDLPGSKVVDQLTKAGYYFKMVIARNEAHAVHIASEIHTNILVNYEWGKLPTDKIDLSPYFK
jgi:hypothetical protein